MRHQMENTTVPLFVGHPIDDPGEVALISRLRADLSQRRIRATLYANFIVGDRTHRQVDLLVRTECRTAHVEIKDLSSGYPLRARLNGPWEQLPPGGPPRSLGKNAAEQVIQGTYAISDAMGALARLQGVTAPGGKFYTCIDSIVAVWRNISDGSEIEPRDFVTVLGYDDLLLRLTTPRRMVPWSDGEWDAFARRLGLHQEQPESESERRRRSSLDLITDYRLQAEKGLAKDLRAFVDVGTTDEHDITVSAAGASQRLASGGALAVVGSPGTGKTFLVKELARRHCGEDRLVIWVEASDSESGQFEDLLGHAIAPYSKEHWSTLVGAATEFGVPITVVVDGLNDCGDDADRDALLQGLSAFALRYPADILITSTTPDGLSGTLDASVLDVREPDRSARLEILAAHGAKHPWRISEQFRTPYELAIAAQCESELDERASVTELHTAYIRSLAPTDHLRAGLRLLASRLHERLRTSFHLIDVDAILNAPERDLPPGMFDDVLACPLLFVEGQRVRFRHDLIAQFFAAADLVHSATDGHALGALLGVPANRALAETALGIAGDPHRVWDALQVLADPELVFSALTNGYGADAAELAIRETRDVLERAIASTTGEAPTLQTSSNFIRRWATDRQWTEWELALLVAAGWGLTRGLFVSEVCELIDRTDKICRSEAHRLHGDGDRTPVSDVVGATYAPVTPRSDGHDLAASYVVRAFLRNPSGGRGSGERRASGLASRFVDSAGARSWGRFFLAVAAVNPGEVSDQALFASLLRRAWDARGYHLQLHALEAAYFFGGSDEPYRSEILDALQTLEPKHPFLLVSHLEALARFGEVESTTTEEDIQDQIRAVINHPEGTEFPQFDDCCQLASGIVSNQFEDEAITGPYFAAVQGLARHEKVRLFVMAAHARDPFSSMHLDWTMRQLVELVPTGDAALDGTVKSVFATFLDGPPEEKVMWQEDVNACITAIRGWAQFEPALPPLVADSTPEQRNWHLIANLLFAYERNDAAVDEQTTWNALLHEPQATIRTMASMAHAALSANRSPLGLLVEDYPGEMRRLFEWALNNLADLPADLLPPSTSAANFVMHTLGQVGDEPTAGRLQDYVRDPDTGSAAVNAIQNIHQRLTP